MSKPKPNALNSMQIMALRHAAASVEGRVKADRCTGKALRDRGFAASVDESKWFFITSAGRARAKFKADVKVVKDGVPFDPSLMEDLK
jgi:hypothetical protein